ETFAAMMTDRGREIGLTNSTFRNATGWPDPEHQMTARDLATLARFMVRNYPDYYALFAETEFTWQGIRQPNRNPLLGSYRGADGLKTGHTESAGYGLVASAERDGRRLISVVNGLGSDRERAAESRRLLNIGFQEFDNYTLLSAGQTVDEADVWLGDRDHIPLVVADQLRLTLPRDVRQGLEAKLHYQNPVPAPVEKGAQIGTLRLTAPEMAPIEIPVLAGESAGKLGFFGRISAAFNYLLWGASSG
ncbi:MAG TPA: D-alanyl-D-alanine carboxypeptidase, partial [Alphaproteobacteria bacterium]|nr:D-alanyl-D-alanine carboxypeptidase [Alphaproteobacteria bacterium]